MAYGSRTMKPPGLDWLLEREDPPIRFFALRDLLGRSPNSKEVFRARDQIRKYSPVRKLLNARTKDGYWPPRETCYTPKWTSTVWPLMLLGEMGLTPDEGVKRACEKFLDLHQLDNGAFTCPSPLEVKRWQTRHPGKNAKRWEEPCLTGNMIRTLLVFGYGEDRRVKEAIDWMPEHQLDDGGWNCNYPEKKVKHSSFMSTIEPLWAYSEIPRKKWTRKMKRSIEAGSEFLLMHPMYYYYDALHGLRVLTKLGYGDDERVKDAVHLILSKQSPDGKWLLEGDWSREPESQKNKRKALVDVEELWKPSKWITLNCYRALTATGDLDISRK